MKKFVLLSLLLVACVSSSVLADGRGRGRGYYGDGYSEYDHRGKKFPFKKGRWAPAYGRGTRGYPAYSYYPAYPAYPPYPPPPPAYGYYSCPPPPVYGPYYRRSGGPYYGRGGSHYPRRGGVRGRIGVEIFF